MTCAGIQNKTSILDLTVAEWDHVMAVNMRGTFLCVQGALRIMMPREKGRIVTISSDTGTPAFNNKQVMNVPHVQADLFADVTVPRVRGLHLMPGCNFASRKQALRDDTVSVPSHNLFNLGARYTPGGEQGRVTFRIFADNVTNKRYWSDTGASYGDTFLWEGAPATVRLSAHYRF